MKNSLHDLSSTVSKPKIILIACIIGTVFAIREKIQTRLDNSKSHQTIEVIQDTTLSLRDSLTEKLGEHIERDSTAKVREKEQAK